MTELRACPFCGGASETDKYAPNMAYCIDGLSGADNDDKKCYNDAILSVDDWNTRPLEDALRAEIERLNSALDKILAVEHTAQLCHWAQQIAEIKRIARAAREVSNE